MACGTPVVASRIPAFQEIAGDAAALADPKDPGAFAESIQQLVSNRNWADHLRKEGLENVRRFTWTETARRVLEIYHAASGK
jgi:glycosyltransferase involved in cell wall biosynthesis